MPIYTFQNPETGETIDVRQRMTDKHEYTDENGLKWTRVFEVVNVGFDTNPNIFSSSSFATNSLAIFKRDALSFGPPIDSIGTIPPIFSSRMSLSFILFSH